jgi:hypothetical protein
VNQFESASTPRTTLHFNQCEVQTGERNITCGFLFFGSPTTKQRKLTHNYGDQWNCVKYRQVVLKTETDSRRLSGANPKNSKVILEILSRLPLPLPRHT